MLYHIIEMIIYYIDFECFYVRSDKRLRFEAATKTQKREIITLLWFVYTL